MTSVKQVRRVPTGLEPSALLCPLLSLCVNLSPVQAYRVFLGLEKGSSLELSCLPGVPKLLLHLLSFFLYTVQ